MVERTLAIIKPDAVGRGLTGEAIARLERKGLKVVGLRLIKVSPEKAEKLYSVHKGKSFYDELIHHITSAPVVTIVLEAPRAVAILRAVIGSTDPLNAAPGSIRGDFGLSLTKNVIHASDSPENAEKEIGIFFEPKELAVYKRSGEEWL